MAEIKKTLEILKARWSEVTLIIGLGVLSVFSNELLQIVRGKTTPPQDLLDLSFIMALMVITMLLTIGFQRTFYTDGPKRQSPIVLLRTGTHFFWRMIGLALIYIPIYGILVWLTFLTIKQFTSIETGFPETAKASPIVYQLCFIIPGLILIKPLLFIFPLIVVLDCRISRSFKLLKHCKLSKAKELVALFVISMVLTIIWLFLPFAQFAGATLQNILIMARTIIQSFIGLMIAVMAVRFVASQNLIYDNGSRSLNSPKSPI